MSNNHFARRLAAIVGTSDQCRSDKILAQMNNNNRNLSKKSMPISSIGEVLTRFMAPGYDRGLKIESGRRRTQLKFLLRVWPVDAQTQAVSQEIDAAVWKNSQQLLDLVNSYFNTGKYHGIEAALITPIFEVIRNIKVKRADNNVVIQQIIRELLPILRDPTTDPELVGKMFRHYSTVTDLDDPQYTSVIASLNIDQLTTEYHSDYPRFLTEAEIKQIADQLPVPTARITRIREHIHQELKDDLSRTLRTIKVPPSQLSALTRLIITDYRQAPIRANYPVGITAAEAMGGPITQMALNSFHSSGSSKSISLGYKAFEEIANASKVIKNPVMTIAYRDPTMTFDRILDKVPDTVSVSMKEMVRDIDVYGSQDRQLEYWYHLYRIATGRPLPTANYFLRIQLDPVAMFEHKISLQYLTNSIDKLLKLLLGDIELVHSTEAENIIDIYPVLSTVSAGLKKGGLTVGESNTVPPEKLLLSNIIKPAIMDRSFGGIKGIEELLPSKGYSTLGLILTETELDNGWWQLELDIRLIKKSGFRAERVAILAALIGYTIRDRHPVSDIYLENYLFVQHLEADKQAIKPRDLLRKAVDADRELEDAYEASRKQRGHRKIRRAPSLISIFAENYLGETTGINMGKILQRSDVDYRYTLCNNMHEIFRYFGIGAVRNYLVQTFYEFLNNNGSYIDARHFTLMADQMTRVGFITPLNFMGANRQQTYSTMTLATQSGAYTVFSDTAIIGRREPLLSYSDMTFTGQITVKNPNPDFKIEYDTLANIDSSVLTELVQPSFNMPFSSSQDYVSDTRPTDLLGMNLPASIIDTLVTSEREAASRRPVIQKTTKAVERADLDTPAPATRTPSVLKQVGAKLGSELVVTNQTTVYKPKFKPIVESWRWTPDHQFVKELQEPQQAIYLLAVPQVAAPVIGDAGILDSALTYANYLLAKLPSRTKVKLTQPLPLSYTFDQLILPATPSVPTPAQLLTFSMQVVR